MTEVMIAQPQMNQPPMNQSRSLGAETISNESNRLSAVPTPSSDDRTQSNYPTKEKNISKGSALSLALAKHIPNGNEKDDADDNMTDDNPKLTRKHNTERLHYLKKKPQFKRTHSCPAEMKYDDCREFDAFAGEWIDSKGQTVLISPWGVIRYPNNPKLRFEAIYMGPNHLSVTFDKDPKRRKFVGKLNHDCELLIWSNDTKWAKKGSKHDPRFHPINGKNGKRNSFSNKSNNKDKTNGKSRNGSCLVQ